MFRIFFCLSRRIPGFGRIMWAIYSCEIPRKTKVGGGTKFLHNAKGVIIHQNATIGKNCLILHNVTIGTNCTEHDAPIIKDNVFIGAGSMIIGKVVIGENAVIGAGSLVMQDIPPNTVYYDKRTPVLRPIGEGKTK